MLKEWSKFKGWVVLEYFLEKPNTKTYVKKLSRTLKISPRTAETYLKLYRKHNIVSKEVIGNTHVYMLNNDDYLVRELKKFYILSKIKETKTVEKLKEDVDVISIAIYGSSSSGNYSESSDIDILIITQDKISIKKTKIPEIVRELEKIFNMEVQVTLMDFNYWKKTKKSSEFIKEILNNHILLYGVKL